MKPVTVALWLLAACLLVSGSAFAQFPNAGLLSQTVTGTSNTYWVSYWLKNGGGAPNGWEAIWNGTVIPGSEFVNAGVFDYTEYSFAVTGNVGANTLLFSYYQWPNYFGLDDVAVTMYNPGAYPECTTLGGNLVANCGFETGDFTGWTLAGNTGGTLISGPPWSHSGKFGGELGPMPEPSSLMLFGSGILGAATFLYRKIGR